MTTANQGIQALDVSVHGVGVNHGEVNQYVLDRDASPEQKFQQGVRSLDAGLRARAELLIGEVVDNSDTPTPEALYHLALSLLSRRAPEDLTDEDWHRLRATLDALSDDPGEFGTAGRVLHDLVLASVSPARPAGPDGRPDVARLLAGLPEVRAVQVRNHLRRVIDGIERDARDLGDDEVLADRMAGDRKEKAPYFFTPDPELHPPLPPEEREADLGTICFFGGIGVPAAVVMLIAQMPDRLDGFSRAVVWFCLTTGCVALATGIPEWLRAGAESRQRKERSAEPDHDGVPEREQGPGSVLLPATWRHAVRRTSPQWHAERERRAKAKQIAKKEEFRSTVETLVEDRFVEHEPADSYEAVEWRRRTDKVRRDLVDELTHRHWRTGTPGGLDWLIQLRAREFAERPSDELRQYGVARMREFRAWCGRAGIVLLGVGIAQLIPSEDWERGLPACLLLAASVWWSVWAGIHLAGHRLHRHDMEQYERDLAARKQWKEHVDAKRPGDEEMAHWYDLDQRYLRREVLSEHGMEHRDILFSFSLTEASAGRHVRAKVRNGPPRYSRYVQTLYVLTSSGVWASSWTVDFVTGEHEGRRDTVFRYDAISAVTLESVGVRFGDSRREIVSIADDGSLQDVADDDGLVLHEALRLDLHNGQRWSALLENYDELYDADEEDLVQLRRLALESSGITAGFRILTAMATEGRQWFERRRRQSHRAFTGDRPDAPSTLVLARE
ncbi:hypothetical protein ACWD25_00305 [Streptomyces sp. NPDC002920]